MLPTLDVQPTNDALEDSSGSVLDWTSILAHEMRSPLMVVCGTAQTLKKSGVDIRNIEKSCGHMIRLLESYLELSKLKAHRTIPTVSDFDVSEFLDDISLWAQQAISSKKIIFDIEINAIPRVLSFDVFRVKQIVFNLVGNAIKFTDCGRIKLRLHLERNEAGCRCIFTVEDSGRGMRMAEQNQIFEAFSGKFSNGNGWGLGLYISKELSQSMGGDLKLVSSIPGIGTIFEFQIPVMVPTKCEITHRSNKPRLSSRG